MPKKITLEYELKQKEILNKLLEILGITDDKKSFLLQDIDINNEKQQMIYDLEPDIKKYFVCGTWSCFRKVDQDRKWYNILKSIL